jgi:hypothetical protein
MDHGCAITLLHNALADIGHLPPELIYHILYTLGGLTHPVAISLKQLHQSRPLRDLAHGFAHHYRLMVRRPHVPGPMNLDARGFQGAEPHEYERETHCLCAHKLFSLGRTHTRTMSELGSVTLVRHCHRPPACSRLSFFPYPRSCSLARLLRVMIANSPKPNSNPNPDPNDPRQAWRPLASLSAAVFGGPGGQQQLPLTFRDGRNAARALIAQRLGLHPGDPEHNYLWSLRIPQPVLIRAWYKLADDAPYGGRACNFFSTQPLKRHALVAFLHAVEAAATGWALSRGHAVPEPLATGTDSRPGGAAP